MRYTCSYLVILTPMWIPLWPKDFFKKYSNPKSDFSCFSLMSTFKKNLLFFFFFLNIHHPPSRPRYCMSVFLYCFFCFFPFLGTDYWLPEFSYQQNTSLWRFLHPKFSKTPETPAALRHVETFSWKSLFEFDKKNFIKFTKFSVMKFFYPPG